MPGSVPGTELILRGIKVTIAPLCLDDFVAIEPELTGFGSANARKQMEIAARAAHRSMLANHPDITLADVRQLIDMRNMPKVMEALISTNELEMAKPGESPPAGP